MMRFDIPWLTMETARMGRYYILDGHTPVQCSMMQWAKWFEDSDKRRVAYDVIGDHMVSTIFLGLDHGFDDEAPPLIFETMVFNGDESSAARCSTWEQAVAQHAAACAKLWAAAAAQ
jgi:hypothetical protein